MKILRKFDNREISSYFRNQNIFVVQGIDDFYTILKSHDLIFTNKLENAFLKISFEDNDVFNNRFNKKIINVPNFFDFSKDIENGSKSILKIIAEIVLNEQVNDYKEVIEIINMNNNLNYNNGIFTQIVDEIKENTNISASITSSGNILDYLISNIKIETNQLDKTFSQSRIFKIYIIMIKYLVKLSQREYHIIF